MKGKDKLYKVAPEDSSHWKCDWLGCAGGQGLAGNGWCSFRGDWSDPKCPKFKKAEHYDAKITNPIKIIPK